MALSKNRRQIVIFAVLAVVLCVGLVGMMVHMTHNSKSDDVTKNGDEVLESFGSYVYTEHHSDDSEMIVTITKVYDTYTVLTKYFDTTGAASFHMDVLSDKNVKRFEEDLMSFQLASDGVLDEQVYTKAVLTHVSSSGDMTYTVDPFDISGFVSVDPWSDDLKTIVSEPGYAGVFEEDSLDSVLHTSSKTELYAFMELIYEQIVDLVGTGAIDDVTVSNVMIDDMYMLSVKPSEKDAVQLYMSEYGYVIDTEYTVSEKIIAK